MNAGTSEQAGSNQTCFSCLSFRTGMKILFAWGIFWLWCWFMTSQFMWTGEYNTFNDGGEVTKNVPIIIFCTFLSLIAVLLTAFYLFREDTVRSRLGLVVASGTLLAIAVVFVMGGVPIMWIDILFMSYSVKRTWEEYQALQSQDNYNELS